MASQPSNRLGPSAHRSGSNDYVDFFLANMWTWTPSGMKRALNFFKDLNSAGSTFTFESSLILRVRCMKKERDYIQRNFLKLQSIIEDEITDLQTELDGALSWSNGHVDVEPPEMISTVTLSSQFEGLRIQGISMPDQVMSLEVPEELHDFPAVVAWQDLQARDQIFEKFFISEPSKRVLEQAHGVQIIFDFSQKVVFIGALSADAANVVKVKLTTILRDYLSSQSTSPTARHIFFVQPQAVQPFHIDVRNIKEMNIPLARSAILDPWEFERTKGYNYFLGDVFCLRICREEPSRSGYRNRKWSSFGPFAKAVPGVAEPKFESQLFKSAVVPRRSALLTEGVNVNEWRNDVSSGIDPSAPISPDENAPIHIDENTSICLASEDAVSRGTGFETPGYGAQLSILDQDDPVLHDPNSILQRAMLPSKRTIVVQHPDFIPATALPKHHAEVEQQGEPGKLYASLSYLMRPLRKRRGVMSLRAEIGRYYAHDVAVSGRASNSHNEPANGWDPEILRPRLESEQRFFFTKALTSWGTDIDFFKTMKIAGTQQKKWELKFVTTYFDFHFQIHRTDSHGQQDYMSNMVLEVNAQDYTWTIRDFDSTNGLVYCHCLDHYWDFRVRISHERPLEHEEDWGRFAQALVSSLEVESPQLRFQHTFREALVTDCPITIHNVRIRQVYRAQHHNRKTFLDITRVMPTEADKGLGGNRYRRVRSLPRDSPETGVFSQWFEASISSARLEELLQQNERLIPGEEADWTVEQVQKEGLLGELTDEAFAIVKEIDGVGVLCDNGHEKRKSRDEAIYPW